MILYAKQTIQELKKIHVYSSSRTSLAILQILLRERWHCSPQIIRHDRHDILSCLQNYEGVLMLHDIPPRTLCDFPIAIDLASEWYRHTHCPSPFLVWAARPGTISKDAMAEICAAMYRGIHIKADLARLYAHEYGIDTDVAVEFVDEHRRFHFDSFMVNGLEKFRELGVKHRLIPHTPYVILRQQLAGAPHVTAPTERDAPTIIGEVQLGIPLSIQDAIILYNQAPTAELANVRQSLTSETGRPSRVRLCVHSWQNTAAFRTTLSQCTSEERHVFLFSGCTSSADLDAALDALRNLALRVATYISIHDILLLSERLGTLPLVASAKILASGVKGCVELSRHLLVKGQCAPSYDPRSWLDLTAIIHGLGLKTAVTLPSWEGLGENLEQYFLHLEKLRSLHAETHSLEGLLLLDPKSRAESDLRIRVITELFLPDVPVIETDSS
jgi:hypothetical protein